jgi:hypothetical protein
MTSISRTGTSRRLTATASCLALALLALTSAASGRAGAATSASQWAISAQAGFKILLVTRGQAAGSIALGGGYLVWETEGRQASVPNTLVQRDLRRGRQTTLSPTAEAAFGLASTAGWVVYARQVGTYVGLFAVRHDRSAPLRLARWLIAPIDSRGDLVAWAEQIGERQRVLVRNMATGKQWVAADRPRCTGGRCYRIDAVTVARDGVAFDLGAVGPQPSLVVRRRFGHRAADQIRLVGDPQPDLARSSTGAYYHAFGKGWFRWDFGSRLPHFTGLSGDQQTVLAYERGSALLLERHGCLAGLAIRTLQGHVAAVPAPARAASSPTGFGPLCRDLTGFSWSGGTLIASWALQPKISVEAHTDVGLVGVVVASKN